MVCVKRSKIFALFIVTLFISMVAGACGEKNPHEHAYEYTVLQENDCEIIRYK